MGLKGELATMGLEDIFQWLAVGKKTGILEIKGASHTKRVSFADGKVSSVWSSDPRDYLGQFLLASNRITEQQLTEALVAQEDENQVLGKILVNRNLISEAEIRRMVQTKTEESIYDTFLWGVGTFEFHDNRLPDQKTMLISLEVTGIVLEGARRVDEWKVIRQTIKGEDAVLGPVSEVIADMLPLSPEDADVLFRLDEVKTIGQLMQELRRPEFILSKHMHEMIERGMLRVIDPGGHLNDATHAQLMKAKAFMEKEKLQEAQSELRRLLQQDPKILEASQMLEVVQHKLEDLNLDQEQILELALGMDELMQTHLESSEAFLATRVNGVWSIRDVIAVSPFPPEECLAIFAKLIRRGVLKVSNAGPSGTRTATYN